MNTKYSLSNNLLVRSLQKPSEMFTKEDIIRYVTDNDIRMVNFMYPAADGRLKTLNFVVNDREYLDTILSYGERVDGSSLFTHIDPANSDLYVIPRFRTAFLDPFAKQPTVTMLCTFFDKDGNRLADSPDYTLEKASTIFSDTTSLRLEAMGELEFYVIAPVTDSFTATDQRGYHESAPFAKFNDFRTICMSRIAATGGEIKYGHSEVGNFTIDGMTYEQNEIEFLPVEATRAAEQLMLAKWVIRNTAREMGYNVTFAPKITTGKAGSGLHIHMRLTDIATGRNVMLDPNGTLSDNARRLIAGLLTSARSLTAFGNANPTSYFRLVPHQEAPTNICWGNRNRSVLVRVPLGWTSSKDMCASVNPGSKASCPPLSGRQTIEIRSADCSANVYLLLAAIAVAARRGWQLPDALTIAQETYVDVDIHKPENAARLEALNHLPASCNESADALEADKFAYEEFGVFSPQLVESTIQSLRAFDDAKLRSEIKSNPELLAQLVNRFINCG